MAAVSRVVPSPVAPKSRTLSVSAVRPGAAGAEGCVARRGPRPPRQEPAANGGAKAGHGRSWIFAFQTG